MKTKIEIIAELKTQYPTLKSGSDETGYTDLTTAEYETTITEWAENRLAKETKITEAEAQASARTALLAKLGITADEARLLLGGN